MVGPNKRFLQCKSGQDNRGVWRIGANEIEELIAEAYRRTAERIAAGEVEDGAAAGDQE